QRLRPPREIVLTLVFNSYGVWKVSRPDGRATDVLIAWSLDRVHGAALIQLFQKLPRLDEISGFEALGKLSVHTVEELVRLDDPMLVAPRTREAHCAAQFP